MILLSVPSGSAPHNMTSIWTSHREKWGHQRKSFKWKEALVQEGNKLNYIFLFTQTDPIDSVINANINFKAISVN